jgi:hypothetical protein
MTYSNNAEQPTTTLKGELRKEIPQLFVPGFGLRHDAVAEEAAQMEQKWGGARMDPQPRPDVFMEVKTALQAGTRGVEALPPRLLSYVPFAMLYGAHTGRADADTVRAFLSRLHEAGRSAPRRLWPHYLLSLERDDVATNEIALWLKATGATREQLPTQQIMAVKGRAGRQRRLRQPFEVISLPAWPGAAPTPAPADPPKKRRGRPPKVRHE